MGTVSSWSDVLPGGGSDLVAGEPEPRTFEIGLALAGAVSAGAYIAGFLDRLFEAMDDWERRKAAGDNVPRWSVRLRVVSGASAGGICGTISALAASRAFPPATTPAAAARNPFHFAWVKGIDIAPLLEVADLDNEELPRSLLDSTALNVVLDGTVALINGLPCKHRPWIAADLKIALTTCNLNGVPYKFAMAGVPGGFYATCVHADVARFTMGTPRADEFPVVGPDGSSALLTSAALATAAFPIGLAAREVTKQPCADVVRRRLDWQAVIPLSPAAPARAKAAPALANVYTATVAVGSIAPINIVEPVRAGDPVLIDLEHYAAVDGGTMDNEPMEVARLELAGAAARNPREGHTAKRAVILVHPLVEMPGMDRHDANAVNIVNGLGKLLTAYKNGARASAANLALAARHDVYSRFLVAPFRLEGGATISGPDALAGSGLGGFLGFFGEALRAHDFALGRANGEHFLRESLLLPISNPLFGTDASRQPWAEPLLRPGKHVPHLPIIPVFAATAPQPPRPGELDLDAVRPAVQRRVSAVLARVATHAVAALEPGLLRTVLGAVPWLVRWPIAGLVTGKLLGLVAAAAAEAKIDTL